MICLLIVICLGCVLFASCDSVKEIVGVSWTPLDYFTGDKGGITTPSDVETSPYKVEVKNVSYGFIMLDKDESITPDYSQKTTYTSFDKDKIYLLVITFDYQTRTDNDGESVLSSVVTVNNSDEVNAYIEEASSANTYWNYVFNPEEKCQAKRLLVDYKLPSSIQSGTTQNVAVRIEPVNKAMTLKINVGFQGSNVDVTGDGSKGKTITMNVK